MELKDLVREIHCTGWQLSTFEDRYIVLCVHEILDFLQGCVLPFRYEVTRCIPPFSERALPSADGYCAVDYSRKEKLYWYDSQPHPNDPILQNTHPHHKHVPVLRP